MNEKTKAVLKLAGLKREIERLEAGFCPICAKPICVEDFKDELSQREFDISGLCQKCQDNFFEDLNEDLSYYV